MTHRHVSPCLLKQSVFYLFIFIILLISKLKSVCCKQFCFEFVYSTNFNSSTFRYGLNMETTTRFFKLSIENVGRGRTDWQSHCEYHKRIVLSNLVVRHALLSSQDSSYLDWQWWVHTEWCTCTNKSKTIGNMAMRNNAHYPMLTLSKLRNYFFFGQRKNQ